MAAQPGETTEQMKARMYEFVTDPTQRSYQDGYLTASQDLPGSVPLLCRGEQFKTVTYEDYLDDRQAIWEQWARY